MRSPRFPPELSDMVIDYLDGQPGALTNTSLVCKSWLFRSRVHLFRRLTVTCDFVAFATFLRVNPHLSVYIQQLVLQGRQPDLARTQDVPLAVTLEPAVLAVILFQLPKLRSLQLHDVSFHSAGRPPVSAAFQVDELMMMSVGSSHDTTDDVLHILGLFSDIGLLHISSVEQVLDDADTSLHIPHHLRVSSLKLEDIPNEIYLRALKNTQSAESLRIVDAECVDMEDVEALSELLQATGPRIEGLVVNLSQCFNHFVAAGEDSDEDFVLTSRAICDALSPGLAACTRLASLDVSVSLDTCAEDFGVYHDAWDCLAGILDSARTPSLRHIAFELSADECVAPLEELDLDWQPLRHSLSKVANAEKVTFANAPASSWCFSQAEKEVVLRKLPELAQRGALCVGC